MLKYCLVVLHILLTIFSLINLHPVPSLSSDHQSIPQMTTEQTISKLIEAFRLCLFHFLCIIVIWFHRRTTFRLIQITAIVIFCELLQEKLRIVKEVFLYDSLEIERIVFLLIHYSSLFVSLVLTLRLSDKVQKIRSENIFLSVMNDPPVML